MRTCARMHVNAHAHARMSPCSDEKRKKKKFLPAETGALGLLNSGATGYLNSFLQAMYHVPAIRRVVSAFPREQETHVDTPRATQTRADTEETRGDTGTRVHTTVSRDSAASGSSETPETPPLIIDIGKRVGACLAQLFDALHSAEKPPTTDSLQTCVSCPHKHQSSSLANALHSRPRAGRSAGAERTRGSPGGWGSSPRPCCRCSTATKRWGAHTRTHP